MDNIKFVDLAIYLVDVKTLVFADVHLGYEEEMRKSGVRIPFSLFKGTVKRFEYIIQQVESQYGELPKYIVVNGDLKHVFGKIRESEWSETLKFIDLMKRNCEELIVIQGNHDKVLYPITDKRNLKLTQAFEIGTYLICHGDAIIKTKSDIKTIIIGHQHPAIKITDGVRKETYKCFIVGAYKKQRLIVLPSFFDLTVGSDILKEQLISPYLSRKIVGEADVFVVNEGEVLEFGKVKELS